MSITPYSQKKMRAKDGDEEGEGQIRRRIGILDMPDEIFFAIFDSLPPSCPWLFAIATVCRRFAAVLKAYNLGPVNTPPRFYLSDPEILDLACRSGLDLDTMDPAEIGRAVRGMSSGRAEMLEYLRLDKDYEMPPAELAKFSDADWVRFCKLGYDWIFRSTWNLRQEEYYKAGIEKTIPDRDPVCRRENACPYHCFCTARTSEQNAISLQLKGYRWPADPMFFFWRSHQLKVYALETGASPSSWFYHDPAFIMTASGIDSAIRLGLPKSAFASLMIPYSLQDNTDLLEYMHSIGFPMHADLCNFFVHLQKDTNTERIRDCIRRLLDMGVQKSETVYFAGNNFGAGHIELLEYLAELGFPLPTNLAFWTARHGSTEGVMFALEHGCEKDRDLTIMAVTHGTPEMLRRLLSYGVPLHPEFCQVCLTYDSWQCLNEARRHGLPLQIPKREDAPAGISTEMSTYLETHQKFPFPIKPSATLRERNSWNLRLDFRVRQHYIDMPRSWDMVEAFMTEGHITSRGETAMGGLPGRVVPDPPEWNEDYIDDEEWARDRLFKHLTRWFYADAVNEYIDRDFPRVAFDVYSNHDDFTIAKKYAEYWDAPESRRNDPIYPSLGREYRNGRQRNMEQRSRRMLGGAAE
jgi:hypothetical protein